MKPDLIFANSPYGKPGVEITKYIMDNFPDANYAMLNTRSAFKKYYDKLACQYATIGKYLLGTNENLHWVEQAILLATNGWTEVVDNRKKEGKNKVGIDQMSTTSRFHGRISHLVGIGKSPCSQYAQTHLRTSHLVGAPVALKRAAWNHRVRNATIQTTSNLRNGYIYVSFETFEEACECAIDIISWTNPTDSHYRCIRWGFVCGLIPHEGRK